MAFYHCLIMKNKTKCKQRTSKEHTQLLRTQCKGPADLYVSSNSRLNAHCVLVWGLWLQCVQFILGKKAENSGLFIVTHFSSMWGRNEQETVWDESTCTVIPAKLKWKIVSNFHPSLQFGGESINWTSWEQHTRILHWAVFPHVSNTNWKQVGVGTLKR